MTRVSKAKFENFLTKHRSRTNRLLNKCLLDITSGTPKEFNKAIRYVVTGGKQIRSLLVYIVGVSYGATLKTLDSPACALEMIHAFSLVHDDLPAMDNDTLRRGKPTCHLAFDEATAILVGDALTVGAFYILNKMPMLTATKKVAMNKILAEATGVKGMIGGQYFDLHMLHNKISPRFLERVYLLKTGALISAAVKLGAIAADVKSKKELKLLEKLAEKIGLAFQIQDDILNVESSSAKLGKNVGTDQLCGKTTYPALVGLAKAKLKTQNLWRQSEKIIEQLQAKRDLLLDFTHYLRQRDF